MAGSFHLFASQNDTRKIGALEKIDQLLGDFRVMVDDVKFDASAQTNDQHLSLFRSFSKEADRVEASGVTDETCGYHPRHTVWSWSAGVGTAAADAYRDLRRAQHRARLDEKPTQVEPALMAGQSGAVLALWRAVFA